MLYSCENNIDCKLLITKTKEQKKAAEKLILVSYILSIVPSL